MDRQGAALPVDMYVIPYRRGYARSRSPSTTANASAPRRYTASPAPLDLQALVERREVKRA